MASKHILAQKEIERRIENEKYLYGANHDSASPVDRGINYRNEEEALVSLFSNKWWRMNNLYYIQDDKGRVVKFKCNIIQKYLFNNLHYRNLILKSRQHGITTFVDLYLLDECIFNHNTEAVIIADTEENAKDIFRRKIKFPFDHLPHDIISELTPDTDSKSQLELPNGSTLRVSVSVRGGTFQFLHVSEFGKICARYPEKAQEIVTGAFETVSHGGGQMMFIESTAEGKSGFFYDYCVRYEANQLAGIEPGELDFKFFFFPWYLKRINSIAANSILPADIEEYFAKLEKKTKYSFSIGQKTWYYKKGLSLGELIKREHPSTPDEAWESAMEGTYFSEQLKQARIDGRITNVPVEREVCVDTWWDLGMNDTMAIWFTQTVFEEIRVIDYYENSSFGFPFYINILAGKNYRYGMHHAPHDIQVREMGSGKSRLEVAASLGLRFTTVKRVENKQDAIESARAIICKCWFDQGRCKLGIEHLESYRKEWNERLGTWANKPLHDEHSNGADAFQTLAMGHSFNQAGVLSGNVDTWTI